MFHTSPSSHIFDEHVVIFLFRREICVACVDFNTLEKKYNKLNLKVKKIKFQFGKNATRKCCLCFERQHILDSS